jgi:hypothetical protein
LYLAKVEEPVPVRVVIWTVKILLYMIFQSLKPVSLLLAVQMSVFSIYIGRKMRFFA